MAVQFKTVYPFASRTAITARNWSFVLVLSHVRLRPVRIAVTESPTSEGSLVQLLEAFPWDSASRRLLQDRDGTYGEKFSGAARWLGIRDVLVRTTIVLADRLCGAIDRQVAGYKLAD